MLPIDEIRNKLRRRGYDVGIDVSRKDICKSVYLVNIDDSSVFFSFPSEGELAEELLFGSKSECVNEYVEKRLVSFYRGGRYIISRSLNNIPMLSLDNNTHNLVVIHQFLKESGYNINCLTSRKEICELLEINLKSTKKEICRHLGIVYSKADRGWNSTAKRQVRLTNVRDDTHVIIFGSMGKTARELGINLGDTL